MVLQYGLYRHQGLGNHVLDGGPDGGPVVALQGRPGVVMSFQDVRPGVNEAACTWVIAVRREEGMRGGCWPALSAAFRFAQAGHPAAVGLQ